MNKLRALSIRLASELRATFYASRRQVYLHLAQCGLASIE
jgi:hypothetical protein